MGAARYKPYPEYKPSGVEWLGDIPKGWDIFNGKRLFGNRREIALPTDEQLAASQAFGVVPQSVMMARNNAKVMLATKGTASFRHVEKDDFVISLRSFEGGIEHSAYSGCVSPAYTVLEPLERLDPPYFRYLLKSTPFVSALQATTDSLRDGKSISYEQFGAIALNLPSPPEQTKIAAFLDYETGKIDALITKQERLIALLEEKRQAVISHAVTKGLNPTAPLRPSGIDWLGDVPEHWELKKLKHVASFIDGDRSSTYPSDSEILQEGIPFVSSKNIVNFRLTRKNLNYISPSKFAALGRGKLQDSDLVITVRGTIGHVAKFDADVIGFETGFINAQMSIIRPHSIPTDYLLFLSESSVWKAQLDVSAYGSTVRQLSNSILGNLDIVLPPQEELKAIQDHLSKMEARFKQLSNHARSGSALLKERRTALISAAVTGKIDVRDWQPPQPLSDTDLSTETLQEAAV